MRTKSKRTEKEAREHRRQMIAKITGECQCDALPNPHTFFQHLGHDNYIPVGNSRHYNHRLPVNAAK